MLPIAIATILFLSTRRHKVIFIRANSRNYRSVHASSRKFQARVDKTFRTVINYVPGTLASYTG